MRRALARPTGALLPLILLVAASALLQAAAQPIAAPGGACGASAGRARCPSGQCCSQWGFCGTTPAHCAAGCQPSFGACTGGSGGSGGGSSQTPGRAIITATVTTPGAITSFSQLATSLLGGQAGMFLGSLPSAHVNQLCTALVNQGSGITVEARLTANGATAAHLLRVTAIGGCLASPASPAGVQAVLTEQSSQRRIAVLCGNSGPNGEGLDALTPVPSCDLYATGTDVTQFYNQLVAASGRRKLKLFGGGGNRNDCRGCRRNCRCGNGHNISITIGPGPKCFPANAKIRVQGLGQLPMSQLEVGHKVLTLDASGRQAFDEVVFFGHRDADAVSTMTSLTVRSATNATLTLRLSARHFVPTLTAAGRLHHKYARDVSLGDRLLLPGAGGNSMEGVVVYKSTNVERGLFNPYTKSGRLVVDGVLASAHSDWLLDDVTPAWAAHLLPHVYQVAFKPITWAYNILGPRWTAAITEAVVPHVRDLSAARAALRAVLGAAVLALGLHAGSLAASVRRLGPKAKAA